MKLESICEKILALAEQNIPGVRVSTKWLPSLNGFVYFGNDNSHPVRVNADNTNVQVVLGYRITYLDAARQERTGDAFRVFIGEDGLIKDIQGLNFSLPVAETLVGKPENEINYKDVVVGLLRAVEEGKFKALEV